MPDTDITHSFTRAQATAVRLRERLTALGLTDTEVRQILPTGDINGRPMVRFGVMSLDSAELILAALTPAEELTS